MKCTYIRLRLILWHQTSLGTPNTTSYQAEREKAIHYRIDSTTLHREVKLFSLILS